MMRRTYNVHFRLDTNILTTDGYCKILCVICVSTPRHCRSSYEDEASTPVC